jgi:hypothetical protein
MKNKLYFLSTIFVILLAACQKLDREIITDINKTLVGSVQGNVSALLTSVYTELREGFADIDNVAMMAAATDEAEHSIETSTVQNFNIGSWNSISNPNNVWGGYFRGNSEGKYVPSFN